ncbi:MULTISPECIES: glycoside hydrolase family 3 C-terminal domain-containing protein [unclassified Pseudonocardia]|jgi:beta-glucosidase|uniref:glycoside hydrolase family 3 C-terminal domain-containing protein n=1 Tax=unclassified Pseudonocardia TaxID=2619320 RepID=UPI000A687754|nr:MULTISPECIES: glycoside hydrolase family 3 C-terminal domain-containing protein [unclassified Pseudonocardia]
MELPPGLTVTQKAALCLGSDFWHTAPVPGHGIEAIMVSDGPHGLRAQPEQGDHVGLSGSTPATCFPTASALGSSWDVGLAREIGAAIGVEAREQGVAVVLGPGVNIKRSPLCGRNFEYLSEDPLLAGHLGAALVEGLQSQGVGASVKHFAANNQETDRLRVSADVDERTLREIYLPAFEHVVTTAGPWTVMCAYNKVNGEYASQHHWLLTDVLRGEWGFDGLVVSDWGAVHDRVAALVAGLDLEMPPHLGVSDKAIVDAVADGSLDEAVLDTTVGRVLGLVERARSRQPATVDVATTAGAHHALARRAAADCTVLLRNDDGVLPLVDRPGLRVLVVGEFARTPRYQGAGSSQVNPTRVDNALDALRAALPSAEITFGGDAAGSDVILAFLGLPPEAESEGFDRTHIDLPPEQLRLVADLAESGVPIVAVLANGGVVRTSTWEHHVAAVVECWLGGQAAGSAVADVLTGAVDPGGRLAETIPLHLLDHPSSLNFPGEEGHVRYGEGVFVGYRGFDATERDVAYPFGHGLSYTTFAHRDLTVTTTGTHDGGDLALTVEVTVGNTGARAGREVVQLYVGDPESTVARPPRELKGFAKVTLAPGEEQRVTFTLGARDLSYWSTEFGRWVLEGGEFGIAVGASSRDLTQRATVTVDAIPPHRPLTGMSTLQEWLADPEGAAALVAAVGTGPDGRPLGVLGNAEMLPVIGNFPLAVLAAFTGLGIDADALAKLGVE